MATAKANIIIGGKKIDPYHVSVQQRCDWHHQFEVAVSTEKIEKVNSLGIDDSVDYIGKTAELSIDCATGNFKFKGLITSVYIDRSYTGDSLVILSGHSPTYLLEDGVGTKSYEEKDLAAIANEIVGTYPANLLNPNVSPQYTTPIPYVVRYKETNYQFLARLAAIYGEWFYYDGQGLVFGKLPNPASLILTLGKDLDHFDYGVQMRPSKFKYQFYNYQENRIVENVSTNFKPGWLDNYGKKALDAADGIFPNEPTNPVWHDAPNDALIKHLAEAHRGSVLSDSAFFRGQSTHAGIQVGGRIQAKGINKIGKANVLGMIGNFRITAVTHHLDANKDYRNTFEAIPITVTVPPMNKNVVKPEAESQVAVVKENHDPEGLGRVRAQFKWQSAGELTPWIRVITSSAAGGRGMYFTPELEDEVYIGFDQANPDRPYVVGSLFHGNAKPIWGSAGNDTKALRTRSGNRVELNDADGSVNIIDPSGNTITMAGNGEITISAPNKLTLTSTDINILAGNSINMQASPASPESGGVGIINISAKEDISIDSETKDISVSAAEKNVNISGKENVNIDSQTKDISLTASSKNINLKANSGKLDMNAKETLLKTGKARMVAKGKFQIQGAKVEINKG